MVIPAGFKIVVPNRDGADMLTVTCDDGSGEAEMLLVEIVTLLARLGIDFQIDAEFRDAAGFIDRVDPEIARMLHARRAEPSMPGP